MYTICNVIKVKDGTRDELREFLMQNNISTGINYPVALPFLEAYKYLNLIKSDFPNAFAQINPAFCHCLFFLR